MKLTATSCLYRVMLVGLALTCAHDAVAQGTADDIGVPRLPDVIETQKAEADPLARIVFGGSMGMMYYDNIYRSSSDEESDLIAVVAPGISLRTDLGPHEARARLRVEGGKYLDNSENDYVDIDAGGSGKYAVNEVVSLLGNARFRYDHVDIGSFVDNPERAAAEPTIYREGDVGAGLESDNGEYYGLIHTGLTYFDYDDVDARGGGMIINDDRDRREWNNRLRLGYYATPELLVYAEGSVNRRSYREEVDSTALYPKDSDGLGATIGMALGNPRTDYWYDANLGYISQDYDDPFLPDVDTLGVQAKGEWRLANDFLIRGDAIRGVEENTLFGASGHIMTRARAGFEYDVAPQWTVEGDLRYTLNDFQINPASGTRGRQDDVFDLSALVEYNIVGDYYGGVEYVYVNRDSTDSAVEYTTNAVIARLSLKY